MEPDLYSQIEVGKEFQSHEELVKVFNDYQKKIMFACIMAIFKFWTLYSEAFRRKWPLKPQWPTLNIIIYF